MGLKVCYVNWRLSHIDPLKDLHEVSPFCQLNALRIKILPLHIYLGDSALESLIPLIR